MEGSEQQPDASAAAARLQVDVERLAGDLPHRGPNTVREREAAAYIEERLSEYSSDVQLEPFDSIESPALLFAAYYAEFLVVTILAHWFPWFACGYGGAVFVLYLAEFSGFHLLARLLPQFESQNVTARFMAGRPRRQLIVTAHYDSPKHGWLRAMPAQRRLRWGHMGVVFAMVTLLGACAAEALGGGAAPGWLAFLRYAALAYLLGAAAWLMWAEARSEYTRGAADNASGVAVLIDLARRFYRNPSDSADLILVATGSKESWNCGIQRFLAGRGLDKAATVFVNIDDVAGKRLCYSTSEGMLHASRVPFRLRNVAEVVAAKYGASPVRLRGLPSDAALPLARGYAALSITSSDHDSAESAEPDLPANLDYERIEAAAEFAETLIRCLAGQNDAAVEAESFPAN